MDISVTSIDILARLFNHSLRNRGFTRAIHREMYAGQSSGMRQHHFGVLGLVVAGNLSLSLLRHIKLLELVRSSRFQQTSISKQLLATVAHNFYWPKKKSHFNSNA